MTEETLPPEHERTLTGVLHPLAGKSWYDCILPVVEEFARTEGWKVGFLDVRTALCGVWGSIQYVDRHRNRCRMEFVGLCNEDVAEFVLAQLRGSVTQ